MALSVPVSPTPARATRRYLRPPVPLHFPEPVPVPAGDLHLLGRIALCESAGAVEIRAVSDQRLLATLPASTNLPALGVWSPDGRFLAVKRRHDPDDQAWDMEVWEVSGARQVLLVHDSPSGVVSFHPRLPQIAIGLDNSAVILLKREVEEAGELGLGQATDAVNDLGTAVGAAEPTLPPGLLLGDVASRRIEEERVDVRLEDWRGRFPAGQA